MNKISTHTSSHLTPSTKKTPSPAEFLRQAVGRKVVVKLHNNWEYRGIFLLNTYLIHIKAF